MTRQRTSTVTPFLRVLRRICSCRVLEDAAFAELRLPALRSLDISWCKNVKQATLLAMVRCSPRLERLCMRGVPCDDATLSGIASACPALQVVEFGSGNPFGGGIGSTFTAAGVSDLLSRCVALTHVAAVGSGAAVQDSELAAAIEGSNARHLRTLDVSGNTGVGDSTARAITSHCFDVTHLNLFRCAALSPSGLVTLAQLPRLEVLDISHCTALTPDALVEFVAKGPSLRRVTADGWPSLRDPSTSSQLMSSIPAHVQVALR